jgi:hypothetical protein
MQRVVDAAKENVPVSRFENLLLAKTPSAEIRLVQDGLEVIGVRCAAGKNRT